MEIFFVDDIFLFLFLQFIDFAVYNEVCTKIACVIGLTFLIFFLLKKFFLKILKRRITIPNREINLKIYFVLIFLVILSIVFTRFAFIPTILITSYIFLYNQIASQHSFEKNSVSNRAQSVIDRLQKQIDNRKIKLFSQKISETDKENLLYPHDNQDIEVCENNFLYKYLQQIDDDLDFKTKDIIYANTCFLKYEILKKPKIYDIFSVFSMIFKKKYHAYVTREQLQEFIDENIKEIFNIDFNQTTFVNLNFAACWLMYSNFERCDLRFSIFCEACLEFVNLKKSALWNCCFDGAQVNLTDFSQSELFGAKLDKIQCIRQPPSSVKCSQLTLKKIQQSNQHLPLFSGAYYNKYPFFVIEDVTEKLMSVNEDIDGDEPILVEATIFPENFNPKEHGMIRCECVNNCFCNDDNKKYEYLFIAIKDKEDEKVFLKFIDEKEKNNKPIIYVRYDNKIKCFIFDHELLKENYKDWYV